MLFPHSQMDPRGPAHHQRLTQAPLHTQVPMYVYMYSQAAFFSATVLNLISFIFEDTAEKKQL